MGRLRLCGLVGGRREIPTLRMEKRKRVIWFFSRPGEALEVSSFCSSVIRGGRVAHFWRAGEERRKIRIGKERGGEENTLLFRD